MVIVLQEKNFLQGRMDDFIQLFHLLFSVIRLRSQAHLQRVELVPLDAEASSS